MSAGPSKDVAIIGMACIYPGAPNVERYWENILHKVDAVSDAPPEWEAEFFYDPDSEANDRTYCRRGGFLGKLAEFHPTDFGVMPNAVDGTEPDHFLALRVAYEALRNAGISPERMKQLRERTEVIIGRGTYVNRGNTAWSWTA
jgi:acyl transferase domain-containing protein